MDECKYRADIKMPVVLRNVQICKLVWKAPAYHTVMQILHNALYAGAYAFGRIAQKIRIVDGRARKVSGFKSRVKNGMGLPDCDPTSSDGKMISLAKAAARLGICVGSAKSLVLKGILPATQAIKGSQWLVPVDALSSETVHCGPARHRTPPDKLR